MLKALTLLGLVGAANACDGPWTGSYSAGFSQCIYDTFGGQQQLTCARNGVAATITQAACPSMIVSQNQTYSDNNNGVGLNILNNNNFLCQGPWTQPNGQITGLVGSSCGGCTNVNVGGVDTLTCTCITPSIQVFLPTPSLTTAIYTTATITSTACPSRRITSYPTNTVLSPGVTANTLVCLGPWTGTDGSFGACTGCSDSFANGVDTLSCECPQVGGVSGTTYYVPTQITSSACPNYNLHNANGTLTCSTLWNVPSAATCTCTEVLSGAYPTATASPTTAFNTATLPPATALAQAPTSPIIDTITCTCKNTASGGVQTLSYNDRTCPSRTLEFDQFTTQLTCNPWRIQSGGCNNCFNTISGANGGAALDPTQTVQSNVATNTVHKLTCNCGARTTTLDSNICPTLNANINEVDDRTSELRCANPWGGNYTQGGTFPGLPNLVAGCTSSSNMYTSDGTAYLTAYCQGSVVQINSKQCPSLKANNDPWHGNLICTTFNVPGTCSGCAETYSGGMATLTCALCAGGQGSTSINTQACPSGNVYDYYGQLTCVNSNCNAYTQANENNQQVGDNGKTYTGLNTGAAATNTVSALTVALVALLAFITKQ